MKNPLSFGMIKSQKVRVKMIDFLLEPFSYQYMIRALWVCSLVGLLCGLLSSFLMLKGLSLMGDALAHAVVPGVAMAYLLALPYAFGAFIAALLAAFSMNIIKRQSKIKEDAVIGIVFTGFLALGMMIISWGDVAINIQAVILGNVIAISSFDALQILIISVFCLLLIILQWQNLSLIFFDENYAASLGLNVKKLYMLFFICLSATIVAALQAVGAAMVIAMVIIPGCIAYLFFDRLPYILIFSSVFGTFSAGLGVYISYYIHASVGGLIVSLQSLCFLLAFLFAPRYGLLAQKKVI